MWVFFFPRYPSPLHPPSPQSLGNSEEDNIPFSEMETIQIFNVPVSWVQLLLAVFKMWRLCIMSMPVCSYHKRQKYFLKLLAYKMQCVLWNRTTFPFKSVECSLNLVDIWAWFLKQWVTVGHSFFFFPLPPPLWSWILTLDTQGHYELADFAVKTIIGIWHFIYSEDGIFSAGEIFCKMRLILLWNLFNVIAVMLLF